MAGKLLTGKVMQNRNEEIWEMYISNYTQREIAKHFGITQQNVSRILIEWASAVEELPRAEMAKARLEQIDQKISDLEQEYVNAVHLAAKLALSKEIRGWFELRARIRGEFAQPYSGSPDDAPTVHYSLHFDSPEMAEEAQKALS